MAVPSTQRHDHTAGSSSIGQAQGLQASRDSSMVKPGAIQIVLLVLLSRSDCGPASKLADPPDYRAAAHSYEPATTPNPCHEQLEAAKQLCQHLLYA